MKSHLSKAFNRGSKMQHCRNTTNKLDIMSQAKV